MNENQLTIVLEYEFNNPLIQKIDSLIDKSLRDCHKNIFIQLITYVNMIYILQVSLILKQLISQFLIKAWVCMN